jgi:MFS family permease
MRSDQEEPKHPRKAANGDAGPARPNSTDSGGSMRLISAGLVAGWIGLSISLAGDAFLEYVLLVEAARGSQDISVGMLGFLIGLPALFGGMLGALLDRHPSRLRAALIGSAIVSALATTALAILWNSVFLPLAAYAVIFVLGILALIGTIVWQTFLPKFCEEDRDAIKRLVGWTSIVFALGASAGPLLATAAATVLAPRELIMLDVSTFLLCGGLGFLATRRFSLVHTQTGQPVSEVSRPRPNATGLRLLMAEPVVRTPMLVLGVMNFTTFGVAFMVPLLVVERGWPTSVIAVGSSVFVLGGLFGTLVATRFRSDKHFVGYLMAEPGVRAFGLLVVFIAPNPAVAIVGLALFTVTQGMGRVARQSFLIASFPGDQRAKVIGSYQMVVRGLMPTAPLVMQGLVTIFGIDVYLALMTGILTALTIPLVADRRLRDRGRSDPHRWSSQVGEGVP